MKAESKRTRKQMLFHCDTIKRWRRLSVQLRQPPRHFIIRLCQSFRLLDTTNCSPEMKKFTAEDSLVPRSSKGIQKYMREFAGQVCGTPCGRS